MALPYAAERKQFGKPIGANQGVSFKLADMITEIDAADWLTLAGRLAARPEASRQPRDRLGQALRLGNARPRHRRGDPDLGGMGLMDDLPLARFWRDARVERIWDGTSEIQRHIISRDLLRPLGA